VVASGVLSFPSDWNQQFGANLTTVFPPDLGARFRYHERLRPQPSFAQIVERVLARDPDFRVHEVGEMLRVVTHEGEYGAWVRVDGQRDGAQVARFIGAAFLDDFATVLDCIALRPAHFARLEQLSLELVRSQTFEMTRRPRRFFYTPPTGWQAIPSGVTANWYPPDFPNNLSNLVVPPARAIIDDVVRERVIEDVFDRLEAGLVVDGTARDELVSATGVKGAYKRLEGRRGERQLFREAAVFVVRDHAYQFRFETAVAERLLELREIFRGVAGSFRPLPSSDEARLGCAFAAPSNLFDHWAT
jgi:hypothetical protein